MGGLVFVFLFRSLPESPRYFVARGQDEVASKLMSKHLPSDNPVADSTQLSTQNDATGWPVMPTERNASEKEVAGLVEKPRKDSVRDLLSPKLRLTSVLLWIIWFGTSFGAQGFNLYLPTLLDAKNVASGDVYADVFIYNFAGLPGVYLASLAVETRLGRWVVYSDVMLSTVVTSHNLQVALLFRKWVIFWTLMLTAVSMFFFMLTETELQLVIFSSFFNMFSNGAWCAIYTITPESYPTTIRSQGVGVAHAIHSVAGMVGPSIAGAFVELDVNLTLILFICFVMLSALCGSMLPHETRNIDLPNSL
jgi:putative MFS transporter